MKIKRLEISGFKSFADKAVLDFQQGVTGVVGPNGCGKSNIVDAIRWCMGEQSAKNLRGKAMEDVIFIGSDNRKPLGIAEVSLVFSTEDGRAPSKYLEFNEIQLTRRLYRDGESEYLLNKTPCRLLDISELFMDTGVGSKAYSIIEQGKIGQILHSRPEERRQLIEEAAGVTKYKTRKQQALKKIDATRQNLLRLTDVLGEIKRQLNSLQRQAKKAERFREFREELREIDLLFTLRQSINIQAEHHQAEQELAGLKQKMLESTNASRLADSRAELERLAVVEAEKSLTVQQEELFKGRSEAASCESGLCYRRKERNSINERHARLEAELTSLSERRTMVASELSHVQQQHQTTDSTLVSAESQFTGLQEAQMEQEQAFEELHAIIEGLRRELFSVKGEAAHCRSRQDNAQKRLLAVSEQLQHHALEQNQLSQALDDNSKKRELSVTELLQRTREQQATKAESGQLAQQEQLLKQQLPEREQVVQAKRDELSNHRSRLTSLLELEAQFAGYGQGVRLLMTESPLRDQLGGLLADNLVVPEEYEIAVEAALAERLQTVLCEHQQDLLESLQYLHDKSGGRAQLALPQNDISVPQTVSGARLLLSVIEVSEKATTQIQRMLATVHLADTLESALALALLYPDQTFVTMAGDLVASDGTVTGGKSEAQQSGIIHKKREIRLLQESVQVLTHELAVCEEERDCVRATLQFAGHTLQTCRNNLHQLDLAVTGLSKDLQQLDGEIKRLNERQKLLAFEQAKREEEQAGLLAEQKNAAVGLREAELQAGSLEERSQKHLTEQEERRRILAVSRETLTIQRVKLATLREQREANQRTLAALTGQLTELDIRITSSATDQKQGSTDLQRLDLELTAEEERLQALLEGQLKQDALLQAARQQYEGRTGQLAAAEHEARLRRNEREAMNQSYTDLSLLSSSLLLQREHLQLSLQDRHRLNLGELQERLGERELDEVTARIRQVELERLVDELGEVNLMAIEEYAAMEGRYEFLSSQKADLEESLHDLQQAIQRINRTTRQRFLEAFTLINEKFQEVFPRLFCGGRAELKLTDEQDLLETGIDIIVQPPGKKLANVMLLSGGEKALTAVALIFSIFLIKPTPFCLLDEVDAPLDDANIGRFNEMVREMSAISQFIIITHNKATMAVADTLYGVTMEEPGASRLVSVRLH